MKTLLLICLGCSVLTAQAVKVAPYYTPGIGTQPLTTNAGTDTSMDVLAMGTGGTLAVGACNPASPVSCGGMRQLMPRSGPVSAISIYLADVTNLSTLYFSTNPCATQASLACLTTTPTYTAAITGPFSANSVNMFTLATPLMVSKWDGLAVRAEWTQPHGTNLALFSSQLIPSVAGNGAATVPAACLYQLNAAKPSTFTFASMTLIPNNGCPIIGAYMAPPSIVCLGDSICAAAPAPSDSVADAWTEAYPIPSVFSPAHFWAAGYAGGPITYQSMGWSGETAVQEAARFSTDAIPLGSPYILIDGGVNDLTTVCASGGCTGPQVTAIEAAITSMMSATQAAHKIPVVMLIGPLSTSPNGSNARMLNADTINANTIATAPTYGAIVVDWRCTVGQFRSGGSGGNCWDWQAAYLYGDGLGVHPNQTGNALIGALIASLVPSLSPAVSKSANGVAW